MDTTKIIERYFYEDGSLRDIYLVQSEPKDWDVIFNFFDVQGIYFSIYKDGEVLKGKVSSGEIIEQLNKFSFYLTILLNNISLSGYFNNAGFIEFDLTPREVQTEKAFDELISFMQLIANATNKEARLTPEMEMDTAYIVVLPSGKITYCSANGEH